MIWTHIYDLLLKLFCIIFPIIILIQFPYLEGHGVMVIIVTIIIYFISYNYFFRTLASYLYCKYSLKMNVSLKQAKLLNAAYSPMFPFTLKWLPMAEIKELNNDIKFESAIKMLENWQAENKSKRIEFIEDFKNSKLKTKLLSISMYLVVVYLLIAGFLNIAPASYFTKFYCNLLDTDEYYPVLNGLLLCLPVVLIFKAIDKNIK